MLRENYRVEGFRVATAVPDTLGQHAAVSKGPCFARASAAPRRGTWIAGATES